MKHISLKRTYEQMNVYEKNKSQAKKERDERSRYIKTSLGFQKAKSQTWMKA